MIKKLHYLALLMALADNDDQLKYAQQMASKYVCERKKKEAFTISEHDQKMLEKYFDISFAKGEKKDE